MMQPEITRSFHKAFGVHLYPAETPGNYRYFDITSGQWDAISHEEVEFALKCLNDPRHKMTNKEIAWRTAVIAAVNLAMAGLLLLVAYLFLGGPK